MHNKGIKLAGKILVKMLGKEMGKAFLKMVDYKITNKLPPMIIPPAGGWMAFCLNNGNGTYTIIVNPDYHNAYDEVALTVGHELCHVYQDMMTIKGMRHVGKEFKVFRKTYCEKLGFTKESF